jgi:hypothetical protein
MAPGGRTRILCPSTSTTHNTTFSGHFALPNFGHPFMVSTAPISDSGNGEKWDSTVVLDSRGKRKLPTRTDVRLERLTA